MAAKINKDALMKNRFWIMLAFTVVLAIFGLVWLQSVNADAQIAESKKIKDALEGKRKGPIHGPDSIAKRAEDAKVAKEQESIVWGNAYKVQAPIFTWAAEVEAKYQFSTGKFANEITVSKAEKDATWPDDGDGVINGLLLDVQDDYLILQARKPSGVKPKDDEEPKKEQKPAVLENVKIFRTKFVKITSADDKTILWQTQLDRQIKKLIEVKYQTGKYFNDPLRDEERETFKESYLSQIDRILKTVEPLDEKSNGVVQLKNWLYRPDWVERYKVDKKPDESTKFIRFVTLPWDLERNFSDEAWIAQENIWIQREIYRIIRGVNDEIKLFHGKGGEKAGETYTFANSSFQVELSLDANKTLTFTARNLLPRRQKLDLNFRVWMYGLGAQPEIINISGPPLMPKREKGAPAGDLDYITKTFKMDEEGKTSPRKGIYKIEQVLTWETAAIRRIDQVTIGSADGTEIAHSHRTFPEGLRPLVEKKDAPAEEKKGPGDGKIPPGFNPQPGFPGGGQGAGGNVGALAHGLWKDRYSEVSEQSRKIPIAVALIVDQDHVDRVLTAFNNSHLRFLETQVLVNHYPLPLQPPPPEDLEGGGPMSPGMPPPSFGPGKSGFPPPFGGMPKGFGGFGGIGPGDPTGGTGQPSAGSDLESNMELVIYGFMTLYQRYPPPTAAKKE